MNITKTMQHGDHASSACGASIILLIDKVICRTCHKTWSVLFLQLRKARDSQRLAEQENDRQAGNRAGGGYGGPDSSGQWVSMGELGCNDLDQVLGGLGGGKMSAYATEVCCVTWLQ